MGACIREIAANRAPLRARAGIAPAGGSEKPGR